MFCDRGKDKTFPFFLERKKMKKYIPMIIKGIIEFIKQEKIVITVDKKKLIEFIKKIKRGKK